MFLIYLCESEDVVDEEEHVLALLVAEVLCHGEPGEGHAGAGAGGLVHLAVDQRHLRVGSKGGSHFSRIFD